MAPRSLLQLLTLTAAATVFTETAQAAVFQAPDLSNPLENRIQALRDGAWQPQLSSDNDGQLLARYWGNGGGRGWGNGGGWRGGGWGNGGRYYGGGYYGGGVDVNLGWPNGGWGNGGWANVLPGSFVNW